MLKSNNKWLSEWTYIGNISHIILRQIATGDANVDFLEM